MPVKSVDIIKARTEGKAHVQDFTLWPKLWKSFSMRSSFSWAEKSLQRAALSSIPRNPGIYTFVIKPDIANHPSCAYLVYTGRSKDLHERFKQYLDIQDGTRRHSPKMEQGLIQYKEYLYFIFSPFKKVSLKKAEQALIDVFIPPWNDKKTISSKVGKILRAF